MRKSKNSKQKKYGKQTFAGMFFWTWWPIGLAAAIAVWISIMLFINYQTSYYQSTFYQAFSAGSINTYGFFGENYDIDQVVPYTTSYDQYMVRNKLGLCVNGENGFASVLYQNNGNGYEPVIDSTQSTFIAIREYKEDNLYLFSCSPTMIDERAWEYLDRMDPEEGTYMDAYRIEFHDIYVMGEQFIPGAYDVVYYEGEISSEGIIVESFQSDIEVPAGFEQLDLSTGTWTTYIGPLRVGSDSGAEEFTYLYEHKDEVLSPDTNLLIDEFAGTTQSAMCTPVNFGINENAGDNAAVVSAFCYNPWRVYGIYFALFAIITLLITLGMAALIAGKNYRTYKIRVQMEQYRRKTTNALAHDLKSPLMVISGYAENLKENVHAEKREYYADSIMETVTYMNSIISNLFELDSIENPEYPLKKEMFDFRTACEELFREYEMQIAKKGIVCSVEGNCKCEADPFLMKRALHNIIGNAVKYAPQDGEITIVIKEGFYQIRNTGTIDEETLRNIFEPFVKENINRTGENGSGLGLTIVKNIMELHGMTAKVETQDNKVIFTVQF